MAPRGLQMIGIALSCMASLTVGRQLWAATGAANIRVTASVGQKCKITSTEVNFGSYDPVAGNLSSPLNAASPGSLVVTCTRNATGVTLALNQGANGVGSSRRMRGAVSSSRYLNYQLYQPSAATPGAACAYTTVWGDGTFGTVLTPRGTPWGNTSTSMFNVCGQIPGAQEVEQGAYADVVTATVNF